jgi:hypothetical protein
MSAVEMGGPSFASARGVCATAERTWLTSTYAQGLKPHQQVVLHEGKTSYICGFIEVQV